MTWLSGNNATLTKETATPYEGSKYLRIAYNGTANPFAYQKPLETNVSYIVTGVARSDGTSIPKIYMTNKSTPVWTGDTSTDWQVFSFTVLSKGSAFLLWAEIAGAGYAEFDAIYVKKDATQMFKNTVDSHGGTRHLRVLSDTIIVDGDMEETVDPVEKPGFGSWIITQPDHGPDAPDASLLAAFRMFDNGDTNIVDIAAKQYLIDGDMEKSGFADYTATGGATLSKQTGTPQSGLQVLRIATVAVGSAQQVILSTNRWYRIRGYARSDGTAIPRILNSAVIWTGDTSTSWQEFDIIFYALATSVYLQNFTTNQYVEFDSVHVSELPNILDGDAERAETLLEDGDCEDSTAAAWSAISAATLSKQTANPAVGIRYLRATIQIGDGFGAAEQTLLTVGADYRVKGWFRGDGTNGLPEIRHGAVTIIQGTISTDWQYYDETFTASATNFQAVVIGNSGTLDFAEHDDIELTLTDASLLDDSNMEASGVTAYTAAPLATLTKESIYSYEGYQSLRVTYGGAASPYAYQTKLISGIKYRVTGAFRGDGTYTASVKHGATNIVTSTVSTTWQTFDVIFTSTSTEFRLYSDSAAAGWAEFDSIVLTPVGEVMNWVPSATALLSKQSGRRDAGVGSSVLRVETTSAADVYALQDKLVATEYYRVTGWARSDGVATPKVQYETGVVWTGDTSTDWQPIDAVAAVGGGLSEFRLLTAYSVGAGEHCEFDDIEVSPVLASAPAVNNGASNIDTELGPALNFDGSDYVDAGTGFNSVTDVTVEFWADFDDVTTAAWVLNKYLDLNDAWGLYLVNGIIRIYDDIDNAENAIYSTAVSINTRYHIVMQLTASLENKLYVNGSLEGSGTFSSAHWDSFAGSLYLGSRQGTSHFMDGQIQSTVNVYQEEKSAAWVTARYNAGLAAINSFVEKSTVSPRGQLRSLVCGQNTAAQKILTVGETYNVTASAKSDNGANVPVLRNGSTAQWTGTSSTSWQDATANFVAASELLVLDSGQWDNVVVTRVLGNDVAPAAERDQIIAQQYYLTGWYRTDGVSKFRIMDGSTLAHELAAVGDWTLFSKTWLTTENRLKLSIDKLSGFLELDDLLLAYGDGMIL